MEEILARPQSSFEFILPKKVNKVSSQDDVATFLANAQTLFRFGENELGLALVLKVLNRDSYQPGALKLLGKYHFHKKDFDKSIRAYECLLKAEYCFENLVLLGNCYYESGKNEKALEMFEKAVESTLTVTEDLFEVYKNIGNVCCRLGDFSAAEESYNKAFTIKKDSDVLYVNLGILDIQRGDFNEAQLKFRSALEINSKNDKAWVGLAMVFEKMGDSQLALANIANAIDLAPANRTAVHVYSNWCVRERSYPPAIAALQNYLATVENDEEMSLVLIHLLCLNENYDLARLEIERVLLWNPQAAEVGKILANLKEKS